MLCQFDDGAAGRTDRITEYELGDAVQCAGEFRELEPDPFEYPRPAGPLFCPLWTRLWIRLRLRLWLLASSPAASVVLVLLMGLFGFASVPGMVTRVTDHAHGVALAASANVSASNIGNALGAWLGGLAIAAGLGYTAPLYVGAVIVLAATIVMIIAASHVGPSTLQKV